MYGPIISMCQGENQVFVFPNPSNGNFTIHFVNNSQDETVEVALTDVNGKIIELYSHHLIIGSSSIQVSKPNLTQGTYLVVINSASNTYKPLKVVVE